MKIQNLRTIPVAVALQAPLRHANGSRRGRFVRTVVKVETDDSVRFDPNGVWSTEQATGFSRRIEDLNNDYFEDPAHGLCGMSRL